MRPDTETFRGLQIGGMPPAACRLKESVAEVEPCPGPPCPFWDARQAGECVLKRVDLQDRPELARFLLSIRGDLESMREVEDGETARRLFFQRLNAGRSD
jgi:hypothetical protein